MKKILFITFYWAPLTGAAVQRAMGFCRYLPEFGYKPLVLANRFPGQFDLREAPGPHETVTGLDPVGWYKRKATGMNPANGSATAGWQEWIRLNVFIPDTRVGWRRPARRKALDLIDIEKPVLIFTTAPPYTVHRVGLDLRERRGLPWVADFRDPWMENHAYNTAPRLAPVRALNERMESAVLKNADRITCALDCQRDLLQGKKAGDPAACLTLRNGYDPADFPYGAKLERTGRFYISHFGTAYEEGFEWEFFERLAALFRDSAAWRRTCTLRLIGTVPPRVRDFLRQRFPEQNLEIGPAVAHDRLCRLLSRQQLLLLLVNRGGLHLYSHPSKVYEYMASGNPVLAVGPSEHETMYILRRSCPDRSHIADGNDGWERWIGDRFESWRSGGFPDRIEPPPPYSRRRISGRLAEIFDTLVR